MTTCDRSSIDESTNSYRGTEIFLLFSGTKGSKARHPSIPASRFLIEESLLTTSWDFSVVYPSPQTTIPSHEIHCGAIVELGHRSRTERQTRCEGHRYGNVLLVLGSSVSSKFLCRFALPDQDRCLSFFFLDTGISSTNFHFVTPGASRAASPVKNIEMFDPSCPSPSPGNSILLPIAKVAGYLDVALKAVTVHAEARTSFYHVRVLSPSVFPSK